MASSALLLSTPLADSPFRHRATNGAPTACAARASGDRLFASSRGAMVSNPLEQSGGRQLGFAHMGSRGRGRGRVVCEVAVELGGSRSSEGEEAKKVEAGARVRVMGPLVVYHVPKNPKLDVGGMEGEVKEVVTTFKGKPVSATFPYKVQLVTQGEESRKFFVHLKDDEFEVVE